MDDQSPSLCLFCLSFEEKFKTILDKEGFELASVN